MAIYKSAMGKSVDMSSMLSKNERVRAVGNLKVNARGDTIDGAGNIVVPITTKVNNGYNKTVSNAQGNRPGPSSAPSPVPAAVRADLNVQEQELEDSLGDDLVTEAIKAAEIKRVSK